MWSMYASKQYVCPVVFCLPTPHILLLCSSILHHCCHAFMIVYLAAFFASSDLIYFKAVCSGSCCGICFFVTSTPILLLRCYIFFMELMPPIWSLTLFIYSEHGQSNPLDIVTCQNPINNIQFIAFSKFITFRKFDFTKHYIYVFPCHLNNLWRLPICALLVRTFNKLFGVKISMFIYRFN